MSVAPGPVPSGPPLNLPTPAELAEYEKVVPGAAELIVRNLTAIETADRLSEDVLRARRAEDHAVLGSVSRLTSLVTAIVLLSFAFVPLMWLGDTEGGVHQIAYRVASLTVLAATLALSIRLTSTERRLRARVIQAMQAQVEALEEFTRAVRSSAEKAD